MTDIARDGGVRVHGTIRAPAHEEHVQRGKLDTVWPHESPFSNPDSFTFGGRDRLIQEPRARPFRPRSFHRRVAHVIMFTESEQPSTSTIQIDPPAVMVGNRNEVVSSFK